MQKFQFDLDKSYLCRTLEKVPISDHLKPLAEKMMTQMDRPVVFWLDYDGDNNYANRHSFFQNQFWITVKHQDEQEEFDRLILVGLYRGVLERKRLFQAMPTLKYKERVDLYKEVEHKKSAYDMVTKINSFVTTIDAELYLKDYGIITSKAAKKKLYDAKEKGLLEYIKLQTDAKNKHAQYTWFMESEIENLLDYSNVCRVNYSFKYGIEKLISKLYPKNARERYLRTIGHLIDYVNKAYSNYTPERVTDVHNTLLCDILDEFKLDDCLVAKRMDVKEGTITINQAEDAAVYSFIPDNLSEQEFLGLSMRYVREILSLIEEYYSAYDTSHKYPPVGATLIESDSLGIYVNGERSKGYYVSFTIGLMKKLKTRVNEAKLEESLLQKYHKYFSQEDIREQLYRYALYFITTHEYGHILNGDCEPDSSEKTDKEMKADRVAMQMLEVLCGAQSKYHDCLYPEQQKFYNLAIDYAIFSKAIKIANELREEAG